MRERDGRRRMDFLRLNYVSACSSQHNQYTDSAADTGRGTSKIGVGNSGGVGISHGESISSSVLGVVSGDGDGSGIGVSFKKLKGALWGRGEISIVSGTKQGDDDSIGGVVTPSHAIGGVVAPSVADMVSLYTSSTAQHSHSPRVSSC